MIALRPLVTLLLATLTVFVMLLSARGVQTQQQTDRRLNRESELLETGRASKLQPRISQDEIRVLSYNIRWRGGDDLKKLIQLLHQDQKIGGAAILGLQEVDRNKKRTGNLNTVRLIAEELGMYYAWAAPPTTGPEKEEETGVAIISGYPLLDVRRIVLPHEGPGGRRRVALGATLRIGDKQLRFYSVHSETRIAVNKKLEQMKAVIDDLGHYPRDMPAIVLGDLNTWERSAVDKTFKLFKAANFRTPFDSQPTFFRRVFLIRIKLKLDWIWLRGLEATSFGINREIELSDHWPLWVVVKMQASKKEPEQVLLKLVGWWTQLPAVI